MIQAFDIYACLAATGKVRKIEIPAYWDDEDIRHLVGVFVSRVQCVTMQDEVYLYLIPMAVESPFHISNESLKKRYMTSKAVNMDIYLLYLAVIVLFGCFYDSYQSDEPNDFVGMQLWLQAMDEQIESLQHHGEEVLKEKESTYNFNWLALMQKWHDMDSIKETAKKQDARTNSRVSFLTMTKNFLLQQDIVREIGNGEMELTEKAKTLYSSYFMDEYYNHGILDFMYHLDHKQQEDKNYASHQ